MLLKNFTFLYIEDNRTVQKMTALLLRDKVKELYLASDGVEGLELYKEKKPDIIITDINMPKMDGIEMSKIIKEIDYHQPIIFLSGYSSIELFEQSVDIGIDKYVIKPFTKYKLFDALNSVAQVLQTQIDKKELEKFIHDEAKITAMGEMIKNIAHQWRQPLNVISTSASGLQISLEMDILTNDKIQDNTAIIIDQTKYLSKIIDNFTSFFEDKEAVLENFNIKDVINHVISLTSDTFKSHNINIVLDCDDSIMYQNKNQLFQVILNIFTNAYDAFIAQDIKDNRYLFVNLKEESKYIDIEIIDNAKGIPSNILKKIYEPYFTTKHQSQGTGLGLYMANQIISKYFGGIIESKNIEYNYDGSTKRCCI